MIGSIKALEECFDDDIKFSLKKAWLKLKILKEKKSISSVPITSLPILWQIKRWEETVDVISSYHFAAVSFRKLPKSPEDETF